MSLKPKRNRFWTWDSELHRKINQVWRQSKVCFGHIRTQFISHPSISELIRGGIPVKQRNQRKRTASMEDMAQCEPVGGRGLEGSRGQEAHVGALRRFSCSGQVVMTDGSISFPLVKSHCLVLWLNKISILQSTYSWNAEGTTVIHCRSS